MSDKHDDLSCISNGTTPTTQELIKALDMANRSLANLGLMESCANIDLAIKILKREREIEQ